MEKLHKNWVLELIKSIYHPRKIEKLAFRALSPSSQRTEGLWVVRRLVIGVNSIFSFLINSHVKLKGSTSRTMHSVLKKKEELS